MARLEMGGKECSQSAHTGRQSEVDGPRWAEGRAHSLQSAAVESDGEMDGDGTGGFHSAATVRAEVSTW